MAVRDNRVIKRLMIHDVSGETNLCSANESTNMIDTKKLQSHCVGCFNCWVKHPGRCMIQDGFQNIPEQMAACDELVIVSRCVYGGFSPEVKKVLDRAIGYMLPFFTLRSDGQMHHASRYEKRIRIVAHFYGSDITDEEKATARKLVERNALNLNAQSYHVEFHNNAPNLQEESA